ncbi:MAG TPA: hypothetical protein VF753_09855 [Terriglobales bacterium]
MTNTFLQVPTVSPPLVQGDVDVSQLTNPAISTTVLRENVVAADPINFTGQAQVTNARGLMVDDQLRDIMQEVLIELRTITQMLAIGLNITDDPELIRSDPDNLKRLPQ